MTATPLANTIAIARIGQRRIAGMVTTVQGADGTEFPSFFTGHGDHPLPVVFLGGPGNPIEFELTGLTMEQFGAANNREIDVYYAFAMEVFAENLRPHQYDFYAGLNAAVWLRASGLVTPETFTKPPVTQPLIYSSAQMVMASRDAMDHFVAAIREASAAVSIQ
jgi:hypothetical protein